MQDFFFRFKVINSETVEGQKCFENQDLIKVMLFHVFLALPYSWYRLLKHNALIHKRSPQKTANKIFHKG